MEHSEQQGMLPVERRAAGSLAGIFSLRMLGLFMLLPVLSLHAETFSGSTPLLMGVALGAYGLTQALFLCRHARPELASFRQRRP